MTHAHQVPLVYILPFHLYNPDHSEQAHTPDKLPRIQAALSSALSISYYPPTPPHPQEVSGLSANAGVTAAFHLQGHEMGSSEGHSCRIIT